MQDYLNVMMQIYKMKMDAMNFVKLNSDGVVLAVLLLDLIPVLKFVETDMIQESMAVMTGTYMMGTDAINIALQKQAITAMMGFQNIATLDIDL